MAHESKIDPVVLNAGDPCAQDEALPNPGTYANYRSYSGLEPEALLDPGEYAAAETEFERTVQAWLAGETPLAHVRSFLEPLGIRPELKHDRRGLLLAPAELPDSVLADIAEDEIPDAGVLVERVTGDPDSGPTIQTFAALAWSRWLEEDRRAVDAWALDEQDRPLVQAMRAIDRAPPCLYVNGVPQLPLNPKMTPPTGPFGVYVARAYRLEAGWGFSTRLDLPAQPDLPALMQRLTVELWRLRAKERRASWEDVLRHRSLVLYRAASEGAQVARGLGR